MVFLYNCLYLISDAVHSFYFYYICLGKTIKVNDEKRQNIDKNIVRSECIKFIKPNSKKFGCIYKIYVCSRRKFSLKFSLLDWILAFKYVPNDLDKYDPKPSFDVEVRDSNYVADFHIKLTEMIDLSGSEYYAEFYIEDFFILLVKSWKLMIK